MGLLSGHVDSAAEDLHCRLDNRRGPAPVNNYSSGIVWVAYAEVRPRLYHHMVSCDITEAQVMHTKSHYQD